MFQLGIGLVRWCFRYLQRITRITVVRGREVVNDILREHPDLNGAMHLQLRTYHSICQGDKYRQ